MSQVVVGTAGHIDHGKTALVEALTGVNTDRLEEEQRRGMTIDLGFAFLNDRITLIDVPGHEKFIRNMVAGVATIHIGLLVVAADDGIMPQTREHIHILDLLGLHSCLVALTKCDLVDDKEWLDLVEEDVRELIGTTRLKVPRIIRTSTATGEGIDVLRRELLALADDISLPDPGPYFRLPVDRSFLKTGFGTIVTGTVISGECHVGDELQIVPAGRIGKVRKIQSHQQDVEGVQTGDRAALNISGLAQDDAPRGAQVVTPNWLEASERLIVDYMPLPDTKRPKPKQRVRIHLGTSETLARMTIVGPDPQQDTTWRAILEPEKPVFAAVNDRYILRTYSPMMTIGGGRILHPKPQGPWKTLKTSAQTLPGPLALRLEWFVQERGREPQTVEDWSRFLSQTPDVVRTLLEEIHCNEGPGGLVISRDPLTRDREKILDLLSQYHTRYPYRSRMNKENLKSEFGSNEIWFDLVIDALMTTGAIVIDDRGVALSNHEVTLSTEDQARVDQLIRRLRLAGMEPLNVDFLSSSSQLDGAITLEFLHVLKAQETVVEFPPGLWVLTDTLERMRQTLITHFQKSETLSVAELKSLFGITRKTGIPLLEYFDRRGWTRREGNLRYTGEKLTA